MSQTEEANEAQAYEQQQRQAAVQAAANQAAMAAQFSPAPQYSPPPAYDVASQLERLAALQQQGILTPEEFAAQKGKILN
ncbi:MAG TPA: SHOCT domain-containing protein [Propionibacteriaceae bacterium]|nr:SHOCT domain-containing protein [Propionibacteriaceae bacterium]